MHRRKKFDATEMANPVARGGKPNAGEIERSREGGGFEGLPPDYDRFTSAAAAMSTTNVPSMRTNEQKP